jgi:TonB family protein
MKKCKVCGEEFEDKYAFCPLDGMRLREAFATFEPREFNLTMIGDARLSQRLVIELRFVFDQLKRAWPSFKSHPITFTRTELSELRKRIRQTLARPHLLSGSMTAMLVVSSMVLGVLFLEEHSPKATKRTESDELTRMVTIDFLNETKPTSDSGVGAGERGRVGFESGRGEGSRPVPARAQGGGSGGMHDPSAPSQGRLPQPSVIPAPIPTTFARLPPQALSTAGLDIDPALWKDLKFTSYGDPRSKSTVPSNGLGDGGGVGTGNRTGIGEGEGPGFGRGRDGNMGGDDRNIGGGKKGGGSGNNLNPDDPDRVYSSSDPQLTRARVISKPEPKYTEEARKNSITGTVILRVVFSRTGEVTNIRAMQSLQGGLTEKAIAAARQIRFVPATRNGQPVSMHMQLEYNFNLY